MDNIIEVSGLSYTYSDGTAALKNISFAIEPGEKAAVIGPNGAGKSTLLLTLDGIIRGTGRVLIDGIEIKKRTLKTIRRLIGFVFQDPDDQLFSPTVYDDIIFGPAQTGMSSSEILDIAERTLESVGIKGIEQKSSVHLSTGEKKLASLATAIVLDPKILILDEPSGNLDPKHRRRILKFLQEYKKTVIIATHDLDFAAELCSRCIVLNNGEIRSDGAAEKILTDRILLESVDLELPLGSHF